MSLPATQLDNIQTDNFFCLERRYICGGYDMRILQLQAGGNINSDLYQLKSAYGFDLSINQAF